MMRIFPFLMFLIINTAFADSDGYFCFGKGYLLIEKRTDKHNLEKFSFGTSGDIANSQKLEIPDFQVHRMNCLNSTAEIVSWDSSYEIDVSKPNELKLLRIKPLEKPGAFSSGPEELNWFERIKDHPIGAGPGKRVIALDSPNKSTIFELVHTIEQASKPCSLNIRATLVSKSRDGKLSGEKIIFSEERPGECPDRH